MLYVIIIILAVFLLYFVIRYMMLRKAIRNTKEQLDEVISELTENRVVHLVEPDHELEELQKSINESLREVREERIAYARKEKEFKQQIENISHDLRTPLTSIIGYLRLLDENSLDAEDKDNLKIVQRKAETLQRLITQFYDFSRLTTEDYQMNPIRMDVARLLRETVMDTYGELSGKQIEVTVEIPEAPVWVFCDENAISRVFQNLLQNVGRYAHSELVITLKAEEEKVQILFENDVEDLKEQEVEKIFDRFYVNDTARGTSSTGLGLTIAKELMLKMNGNLTASLVSEYVLRFILELKR